MKKLNDALNEINDRYIEEAAQSVRLHNTSARTVRNIAVPVASAAAVAGICLGMAKLGFFSGPQGVDLLPASSDSTESTTATTITAPYAENDFQYPIQMSFPEHIPIVQQTQADIEGIVFGSEFPYMLYADEHKAVFTDGIGGVYSFDLASEQITLAIDIADSMALTFSNFPKDFGADSWNGISLFALGDGQLCCSVTADKTPTATGRGETIKEYYSINFDTLTLDILENFELKDYDIYNGLFDMPYEEGYHALSFNAARIGDTEEYVYIRNCTADIDLLTMYDMQLIELRRWSESNTDLSAIAEAMEGGYYPFTDSVGMSAQVGGSYQPEDDSGTELSLMADGTFSFMPEWFSSYWPHGTYEVVGDIIKLSSYYDGYMWMYRIVGDDLVPLGMARDSAADPSEALVSAVEKTLYYRSAEQQADKGKPLRQEYREHHRPDCRKGGRGDKDSNDPLSGHLYEAAVSYLEQGYGF